MYKPILLGTAVVIVAGFIASYYSPTAHSAKQGELGPTSSCTFTISLNIFPCVKKVEPIDGEDPGSLCFDTPGIESLTVNPKQCSNNTLVIKPSNDHFCISKKDVNNLSSHTIKSPHSCEFEIMTVAAD